MRASLLGWVHSQFGLITILRKNEDAGDDSDAMDVQVEMDHRCLSLVHHGNGTAAKAQTEYFTAEEVHYRSRFYRRAAQGIGSDAEDAFGLYYDGLLGLTHGELWSVHMLWL